MSQYPENNPNYHPYGPAPSHPNRPAPPPGTAPGYGGPPPNSGYNPYPPVQPEPDSGYGSGPYNTPNTPNSGYGSGPYSNPYGPPSGPGTGSNPYTNPATPPPPGPATGPGPYNPYAPDDPYALTMMSQRPVGTQGYTTYPPQGSMYPQQQRPISAPPPIAPTSSAPPKRGLGMTVLIAVIALIVIAGGLIGFVAYNNNQNSTHATATAQAQTLSQQARATATSRAVATATAIASTYPFSNKLVLADPLTNASHVSQYGWDNDGTNCFFANGSYHAVSNQANYYYTCGAGRTSLTNFTFQVQMTIKQGGNGAQGGLIFRGIENNSRYYILFVDTQGNFALDISVNSKGANDRTLQQGLLANFLTGFNRVNTLGIVANGSQISLYVNGKKEFQVSDTTYTTGQVGFLASYGSSNTDVIYNNVKVWQL